MSAPATPHFNGSVFAHPPAMNRPNGVNGHPPNPGSSLHPSSSSRPPVRADIGRIKQELHDVLGEDGSPYWKASNAYSLGQISRGEMESLVRGWLKGSKVESHNKSLLSSSHNASIPTHTITPASPVSSRKRKRVSPDDPDFDTDEAIIEPKSRVLHWASGILTTKDRTRVKRAWTKSLQAEQEAGPDDPTWGHDRRKYGAQMQPGNTLPPLASTARSSPSSQQSAHRLSQLAKGYDLNIAADSMGDIGEFLAVGMDAHLSDSLHAHVHLVGRDRPGNKTVRIPHGTRHHDDEEGGLSGSTGVYDEDDGEVPKPTLDSLRSLLTLNPALHANTSPASYRLSSGVTCAEAEYNAPPVKHELGGVANGYPRSARGGDVVKERKSERLQRYLENGMIKVDATKEERKDKKHSLHWKYEDPASILESVLG